MFELAKQGKTSRITNIFKKMRTSSIESRQIKPNLNSYISVIQSLGYELNSLNENNDSDGKPCHYWGIGIEIVHAIDLFSSVQVES